MSTYALIHGGGGSGWEWHLVAAELRAQGHRAVAPDLPVGESTTLLDYAHAVIDAVGDCDDLVVVGHSFGAFTAPLVADLRPVAGLVLVAGMVPSPGEPPADWWTNTGHAEAVRRQAAADEGLTGNDDPLVCYYHDVPAPVAEEAMKRERAHPSTRAYTKPWPLRRWPPVPTRLVLCTEDRLLPAAFLRRVTDERLGVSPDELASGHCAALAHPRALEPALLLAAQTPRRPRTRLRMNSTRAMMARMMRMVHNIWDPSVGSEGCWRSDPSSSRVVTCFPPEEPVKPLQELRPTPGGPRSAAEPT